MPKKLQMHYRLSNAEIDLDSIESDDVKEIVLKMKSLIEKNDYDGANSIAPSIDFEFNAENMDTDWKPFLDNPHVNLTINNEDDLFLRIEDDALKIDIEFGFEIEIKDDAKPEKFQEWLDENGGWMACNAAGEWSYTQDEGGELWALGVKRKRRK